MIAGQRHRLPTVTLGLLILFCASGASGAQGLQATSGGDSYAITDLAAAGEPVALTGEIVWSEDFELGWGDWYTDMGVWEVGKPTSGPGSAHGGQAVAATNLSGNYPRNTDSRLISPVVALPAVVGDELLNLAFWEWYNYSNGDYGYVQVSAWTDTSGWSSWSSLATAAPANSSSGWFLSFIDLTSYAGKPIRLAFYHTADNYSDVAPGWYIDDLAIWKGKPTFINPETFEFGWGDWCTDYGVWQIGRPTSGPNAPYEGQAVAATNLSGNYPESTDSHLISPMITLPLIGAGERLELKFWQWYDYASGDNGYVDVSVRTNNAGWGSWTRLATAAMSNTSSDWAPCSVSLTAYAGKSVRIGFYHVADSYSDVAPGWYIADVRIWKGIPTFTDPETLDFGWGDWYTDCGVWEIGESNIVPPSPISGGNCAATVLNGNYPRNTDSRLISPDITLPSVSGPQGLMLRFWQWYNYASGDYGYVDVSVWTDSGGWGSWIRLATAAVANTSSAWAPCSVNLTAYAGKSVRIGFYHTADNYSDVALGWYIDDVQITPAPESWSLSEDTGISRTDKLTNDTTPELTFVFPQTVRGVNSDIQVTDPNGLLVVPNSISGWGSSKVVVTFTTPLTKDGQYTVTLKGTITDTQGTSIHAGADKVLYFTLDATPPKVTMDALVTQDTTPQLTGTIDDPDAKIKVIPDPVGDPNGYFVRNNGNGTWVLPDNMINPALAYGVYDVLLSATDRAGNVGYGTSKLVVVQNVIPFSLTISAIGQGSITDPNVGVHSYPTAQTVSVTAVADPNFKFCRWQGTAVDANKVVIQYQNPTGSKITVTVDGQYTLTAVFEAVIYNEPLNNDPGWARSGQWQFGVPTGQRCSGWGSVDPISGHTGQNVIGVNLDGCYDPNAGPLYSIVAGPFDFRGYKNVKLRFWRWLNTDIPEYVKSTVELSLDGTWVPATSSIVWEPKEREEIADMAWTLCEYAIPQADCQPKVYVRWTYRVVQQRAYAYTGWNIDDIQLIGCSGCP